MDLRKLPNVSALRAFEAAARLESFSRAAKELFVTHGAISHQIHALEQECGASLFTRHGKRVSLTPAGAQYAAAIRAALYDIALATQALQTGTRHERRLVLSAMPSFAGRWLTPRIGRFIDKHPELEVELRCSADLVDFSRDDVDVALRFGKGKWPGLHVEEVLREVFFPACSPHYNDGKLPHTLDALRKSTLLRAVGEPWQPWFAAAGHPEWPEPTQGILYQDSGMLSQAAILGQGVALVRRSLAAGDIMGGRLVRLFAQDSPCEWTYYFVCPPAVFPTKRVQVFYQWFMEEIEAFKTTMNLPCGPADTTTPLPPGTSRVKAPQSPSDGPRVHDTCHRGEPG